MLIYNTRPDTFSVLVCGSYFEFKPDQIKLIHNPNIGRFMVTERAYEGLVEVPDVVVEAPASEEAVNIKAEAKQRGIENRIAHLERIKHNLLVSLQTDLDKSNEKISPLKLASPGEKKALEELKRYENAKAAQEEREFNELKALTESLSGSVNKSSGKPASNRG